MFVVYYHFFLPATQNLSSSSVIEFFYCTTIYSLQQPFLLCVGKNSHIFTCLFEVEELTKADAVVFFYMVEKIHPLFTSYIFSLFYIWIVLFQIIYTNTHRLTTNFYIQHFLFSPHEFELSLFLYFYFPTEKIDSSTTFFFVLNLFFISCLSLRFTIYKLVCWELNDLHDGFDISHKL